MIYTFVSKCGKQIFTFYSFAVYSLQFSLSRALSLSHSIPFILQNYLQKCIKLIKEEHTHTHTFYAEILKAERLDREEAGLGLGLGGLLLLVYSTGLPGGDSHRLGPLGPFPLSSLCPSLAPCALIL